MDSVRGSWYARGVVWWLRRNPLYLMSAACMAVGARLYLVSPGSYAGDAGLILVTLGVLQFYKWAVTGILLLLHRSRRSPEDEPSLLLVAALFWTGPMAATIEMSAVQAEKGLLFSIAVLLFALLELAVVHRAIVLQLSFASRLLGGACLLLLVIAPWRLHVDTAAGTNEIFLYLCWWLLGAVALLALGGIRAASPAQLAAGTVHRELAFVAIVLAATATHLVGMNYAFVGHRTARRARPGHAAVRPQRPGRCTSGRFSRRAPYDAGTGDAGVVVWRVAQSVGGAVPSRQPRTGRHGTAGANGLLRSGC